MEIVQATNKLVECLTENRSRREVDDRMSDVERLLASTDDPNAVWRAIRTDSPDIIPFQFKMLMYDRLIELGSKSKYFRDYAYWLKLNGGIDWDDKADQLLQDAEKHRSDV